MSRFPFFTSVVPRVIEFCGTLFRRRVSPQEINAMSYSDMRFWGKLAESFLKRDVPESLGG